MRRSITWFVLLILLAGTSLLTGMLPATQEVRPAQAPGKILRIGVRRLPEKLSPSLATTDDELRVLDLLFEGLVRLVPGQDGMSMFRPAPALAPPEVVPPVGRTFHLPAEAQWSDGSKDFITARDVRQSWQLLHDGHLGWSPSYADRLEPPNPTEDYRFTLKLTQGVLEPQAFMRFPILPSHVGDVWAEAFAEHPVGSGRFRFKSRTKESVILEANPFYASRPGKTKLPLLTEIHFVLTDNPTQALKDKKIDMALDLTPADLEALKGAGGGIQLLPGKGQRSSNRRIYFLALNCAKGPLDKVECRRALAHALPVEGLLDQYYNKAGRPADGMPHQALTWREGNPAVLHTSPFPRGSWPVNPSAALVAPGDLERLKEAMGARDGKEITLDFLYPTGDPVLEDIVKDLTTGEAQKKLAKEAFIKLDARSLDPHDLRAKVEKGEYQIAYYHYDYPDDTFWLWPLLGPRGPRGTGNIFRYDSRDFETLLQKSDGLRDFGQVHLKMRQVHALFATDVPFIPLWQLEPVIAVGPSVPVPEFIDPVVLFADPDRWGWKR